MTKFCISCKYIQPAYFETGDGTTFILKQVCTASLNDNDYDLVTGEPILNRCPECKVERKTGKCGPDGVLFKKNKNDGFW